MLSLLLFSLLCGYAISEPHRPGGHHPHHHHDQQPIVTTPLGRMRGSLATSRLGKTIYSFRGIRYGKAPIGNLRFQPPIPIDSWDDVYDATEDGPLCPQPVLRPISEDCLVLNVHSTKLPSRASNLKRPVIVFFHAGGFYSMTGASNWAGPQYFMDQDIVLVTPNYRIGSLGFISTGDRLAPGNNGLKDQVVILKWIKQNIASFGGDPDLVTIAGYSAGAASVTLHLVSPMSAGLFHRAIIMSASSYGQWPVYTNLYNLAKKQARLVGCPDTNSTAIMDCLMTASAEDLGESLAGFFEFGINPILLWSPVIEPDFGQERFLTENPVESVMKGNLVNVPVMAGLSKDEFVESAFGIVANATLLREMDTDFERVAPICFEYERDTENSRKISRALRTFYLGDQSLDNSSLTGLAELYNEALTGFGVNRAAKILSLKSTKPVYYYRFSYQGRYSHFYLPGTNNTVPYGVVHHDELIYLFYISELFPQFTDADPESITVRKLTSLLANFALTGNPTPSITSSLDNAKWEPFTIQEKKYLEIGNQLVLTPGGYYENRYGVWEELFPLPNV